MDLNQGGNQMIFSIVMIVIAVVLMAVGVILAYREREYGDNIPAAIPIVSFVLAICLFVLSASAAIVPTGYTGVRTTLGQISDQPVHSGFNWKAPIVQSIKLVNNKQQDAQFGGAKMDGGKK
jgi:predicted PurR-regulated permease PerM